MIRSTTLFLFLALALSPVAFAADESAQLGTVWTIHVEANDSARYIDYMKSHTELFKAMNSSAGGYCMTTAGQSYPGQIFVWSFYPNFEKALTETAQNTLDPKAAKELAKLRSIKYMAGWNTLKTFELTPGYERVRRLAVAPEKRPEFIERLTEMEKAGQANGHPNVQYAVFAPVGGGPVEVGQLMVRVLAPTPAELGKYIDDLNSQPKWARKVGQKVVSLVESVSDDTIEVCEQVYQAQAN